MKKRTLALSKLMLLALSLTALSTGCKKDDSPGSATPTKKDLISRQWIQTDLIATIGTLSESVYDSEFADCEQDNIYFFKPDGTFTITENTSKCNPGDPDLVTSGTWKLVENDTKIEIDPATEDAEILDILELTATTFKGSIRDNSTGIDILLTGVYTAK
jgi:Lipocalin-like domain